jgi:heme-degrading monooxygenase HmoA
MVTTMYAVLFIAKVAIVDEEYLQTAKRMRELALNEYGCLEFTSVTKAGKEVSISYWKSEEQITAWKNDPEHRQAQEAGRTRWYESYRVQIMEVVREYGQ